MPQRHRSHQLEDVSRLRFRQALPVEWVCRDKDHDYGVDLEVEIFENDGSATGLAFNVQLKATDNLAKERSVTMETDRVRYLSSLDAPSLIARYCSASDKIYWCWIFNAFNSADLSAKSVTLNFGENQLWSAGTAYRLAETLKILKRLRAPDRRVSFPLACHHQSSASDALVVEQALEEICRYLPFCSPRGNASGIPINVVARAGGLGLYIDEVASFWFELGELEQDEITDCLLYGLAAIFDHYAFRDQAILAAKACIRRGRPSHSRHLGRVAATCLENEPRQATALAILNGIHRQQDDEYGQFVLRLLASDVSPDDKSAAVQEFYRNAIIAHSGSDSVGSIHYSLGNSLAHIGRRAEAIRAFNAARKCDPAYLERAYYLRELGGALFLSHRFKCSAAAYSKAFELDPNSRTSLCLGDALLFAAQVEQAGEVFSRLTADTDAMIASDSRLKQLLCNWYASGVEVRVTDGDAWSEFAQTSLRKGELTSALFAQLMVSFLSEWVADAWADTILLSVSAMPETFPDVLAQASFRCGTEPYRQFRERAIAMGISADMLEELDALNLSVHHSGKASQKGGLTVRMIGEAGFDIVQTVIDRV